MEKLFQVTQANYTCQAKVIMENKDLIVDITGGNVPHLGVIVSYDHKLDKTEEIKFYSHNHHAHKDFYLAERFVDDIKEVLPGSLCVTAGVHVDGISKKQIEAAFTMMDDLAKLVRQWLEGLDQDYVEPQYTTGIKDQDVDLNPQKED
ncbi:prenylated flavin chaperone LpdD [Limosilactobacillus caecicola]|uniref:prenylated flavin chaperone LpdD n=1 Tax=Limosilactobacillus caecicola TaxID=2941332 RepID=UPI00203EB8C3|nr:hypothetical protein [Limosilactobacillus caecicola]